MTTENKSGAIRVLCESKNGAITTVFCNGSYFANSLEDAFENVRILQGGGDSRYKYYVVVEQEPPKPPVPEWRWVVQYSSRLFPPTKYDPVLSDAWYASEQELRDNFQVLSIEWAQKIDATERLRE